MFTTPGLLTREAADPGDRALAAGAVEWLDVGERFEVANPAAIPMDALLITLGPI